jgi:UDP-2-acetamido-2,6-beta-L-arabino-hexul-4-ose reductase
MSAVSKGKIIVVTGAAGFIGRHLVEGARQIPGVTEVIPLTRANLARDLEAALARADVVFHVAGVNRPEHTTEFATGNAGLTQTICDCLAALHRKPLVVMTSSVQAVQDNPYGISKLNAEKALEQWAESTGSGAIIFRLKNVFGKWCRPNYNSVTATFCYNIAHDVPITISDHSRELELIYIDDVVAALFECIGAGAAPSIERRTIAKSYRITLGELANTIRSFRASRESLVMPSFEQEFTRRLYATYLSYLDGSAFRYRLEQKMDSRGSLAEFMKSAQFGQIFVSRTKPGITRGNHYHNTKTEKFFVVEGEALIRFRHIEREEVIQHRVSGREFAVVDIPPGYVHSIENVGQGELVTLFWASEIFDPAVPDCYFVPVLK